MKLIPMDIKNTIEKDPLFTKYHKTEGFLEKFDNFEGPLDFYCPSCGKESVFLSQTTGRIRNPGVDLNKNYLIQKFYRCTRDQNHLANIQFITDENHIIKIGQYPSNADRLKNEISRYRSYFEEDYEELRRAYGLSDHNVGVGAMIYLRRIFERCIERASQRKEKDKGDWQSESIRSFKMNDKISELSDYLPTFIVNNKFAYGILSKSVHELNEQDCLTSFNLLAESIQMILDQEIELKNKIEKQQKLSKELNKLNKQS